MFGDTFAFRAMQGGLEALSLQQKMILQNLANADTPGYQAKEVAFADMLGEARAKKEGRVAIKATVYSKTDPMRPDENSVDPDLESMRLYQNYVQQVALYDKISGHFTNLRYVFNQFTK